jgi:hypothetical protein
MSKLLFDIHFTPEVVPELSFDIDFSRILRCQRIVELKFCL